MREVRWDFAPSGIMRVSWKPLPARAFSVRMRPGAAGAALAALKAAAAVEAERKSRRVGMAEKASREVTRRVFRNDQRDEANQAIALTS
jgi:hypothetical protein